MAILLANNASSLLAQTSIGPSATTFDVQPADAAAFSAPVNPDYCMITLEDRRGLPDTPVQREIVKCTARVGTTMTVVRAQEGTTALTWFSGTVVSERITAGVLRALIAEDTAAWTAALAGVDATISAAVAVETAARIAADTSEASTRAAADTTETNARIAADASEASTRAAADTAEAAERFRVDTVILDGAALEVTNRTNADTTLTNNLNTEITNRANGDTSLSSSISGEASTRSGADSSLSGRISVLESEGSTRAGSGTTDGFGQLAVTFSPNFVHGCASISVFSGVTEQTFYVASMTTTGALIVATQPDHITPMPLLPITWSAEGW